MTHAELDAMCEPFLEKLGEHADAIQILATWNEEGLTHMYKIGAGNWYARQGIAREFVEENQAMTTAKEIGLTLNPPEDE
jgi:hypothetical protein